jgi:hypothetical protein
MTPEERKKRMEERMAAMSPEERQQFQERMATRGRGREEVAPRQGAERGRVASAPSITTGATTIDSLFGPLPVVETRGSAWLYINKQLKRVPLRLGISDSTNTEILEGSGLDVGTEVVTNVILEQPATTGTGNANNPLMGPQRGRGGPGGPGGGSRGGRG